MPVRKRESLQQHGSQRRLKLERMLKNKRTGSYWQQNSPSKSTEDRAPSQGQTINCLRKPYALQTKPKVHECTHRFPSYEHILSPINPVRILMNCFSHIRLPLSLPSGLFLQVFGQKRVSHPQHVRYQWRTQEFCSEGSTNSVEDRENGDLGAVAT